MPFLEEPPDTGNPELNHWLWKLFYHVYGDPDDASRSGLLDDDNVTGLQHSNLSGVGTNTHDQIDSHLADSSDPHGETLEQTNLDVTATFGMGGATPAGQQGAYTQTYSASDRTHANPTASALTDSSGGTASQTLAAITGGGGSCENATKNAVASLADEINKLIADVADVKQALNAVIDDLQTFGFAG